MKDMSDVLGAYKKYSERFRFFVNHCCTRCYKEDKERLDQLMFYGRWLEVTEACEPEEIKWENLAASENNICLRKTLINIFVLAMVIACTIGMLVFKVYSQREDVVSFNMKKTCPAVVQKKQAYEAYVKSDTSLMHCYCMSEMSRDFFGFRQVKFTDLNPQDEMMYCEKWLGAYLY